MWGESSKSCEINCQCSGLITENFRINSGSNATKRKQEESLTNNYKLKMNPHTIDFTKPPISPLSPMYTPNKRRILGEIQLQSPFLKQKSPLTNSNSSLQSINSPLLNKTTPVLDTSLINSNASLQKQRSSLQNQISPLFSKKSPTRSYKRISKVMEERSRFKMSNKENIENCSTVIDESFIKFGVEEEARDFMFGNRFEATREKVTDWSNTKLDFSDALKSDCVPDTQLDEPDDFGTLQDLEDEFTAENFDECNKYEIISTDSPNIISRGRNSSRKVTARNFVFGAPLAESEASTSFNKPNVTATRMLTFDEDAFEFPSPAVKKQAAKKSLKFTITPPKLRHEKSDSSIGSLSSMGSMGSISPPKGLYTSESTTSMESGFISELEEPFLEIEESNSPKIANFSELLSGQIKSTIGIERTFLKRPTLSRSLSFNPESRVKVALFTDFKKKREVEDVDVLCSKRKKNSSPEKRPVLQRAFSENHATIMSAMARSVTEPDLIGDFSQPFALPLTCGNHSDLKSISCDTLAGLLRGEFKDIISDFTVIDCRYPYEFEGGHITNAVNYYTPAQILTLVNKPLQDKDPSRRSVLVFHCEFSLERGPKLSRFLRSSDRERNAENYPHLHYPEVYLLHEGYRAFYIAHPELCTDGYTAMLDPKHRVQLQKHRQPAQQTRKRTRLLL